MILDFSLLQEKYITNNTPIKGIIHIGAHYGEEYKYYKSLNVPIVFFEPILENFSILYQKLSDEPNVTLFKYALGNSNQKITMNLSSNSKASSSVLSPKKHLDLYQHITFSGIEEVDMIKLDDLDLSYHPTHKNLSQFNFLNIDVQGYELEVFKGAQNLLHNIDYIISEVNKEELYNNGVKIEELDNFLNTYGFTRVETNWAGGIWGDAFYIKNKIL